MYNQLDALHSLDPFWIINTLYNYIVGGATSTSSTYNEGFFSFWHNFAYYAINFYAKFIIFSFFVSIALAIIVSIYYRRVWNIRDKIILKILPVQGEEKITGKEKPMTNPKWELVGKHIDSVNQSDWKLAILEADIMLNDLLDSLQLPGDSIGEKLKSIEKSSFNTIEQAWEAHKIRNSIAHEGSDFLITEREARRVIGLYKEVFEEFEMI